MPGKTFSCALLFNCSSYTFFWKFKNINYTTIEICCWLWLVIRSNSWWLTLYSWSNLLSKEVCKGTKLRQLGLQNQIVNDSDFKMSELELWIQSDSKSDVEIRFRSIADDKIWLIFDQFGIKMSKLVQFLIFFIFEKKIQK